jgi:ketosteroid isomerase-like protein
MRVLTLTIAAAIFSLSSPALALSQDDADLVLVAWSDAYASRDHVQAAQVYGADARLRGMDNSTHIGREAMTEFYYWEAQRAQAQSVSFTARNCQVFDDGNFKNYLSALCAGTYELKQTLPSGETHIRPAQFSMALVSENNSWVIYDHVTTWSPAAAAATAPDSTSSITTVTAVATPE